MVKALIIENVYRRNYNLLVEYKTENDQKVFYLIIQHKLLLNKRAIINGEKAREIYRSLKRLAMSGKSTQYEIECKKLIAEQLGDEEKPEESIFIPEHKDIYIVECPTLNEEQYNRLRSQLDCNWPLHLGKPIILEDGITIKKMEF